MPTADGVTRWTYAELWERAVEVARALIACGVGKDSRVGVLMTNRPEWLAAVFGTALAGGVAVTLSTFSTPPSSTTCCESSGVSVLLFERAVLQKDFAEHSDGAGAGDRRPPRPARCIGKFPFLRHLVVGRRAGDGGASRAGTTSSPRGTTRPRELVEATARGGQPERCRRAVLLLGLHQQAQGHLSAHRGVCIQLWRFRRMYRLRPRGRRALLDGQRLLLVGQFRAWRSAATLAAGGTLVLQPTFVAAEALELMEAERVNFPFAWPHQWAQLEGAPNWERGRSEQHAVRRLQDAARAAPDGLDQLARAGPRLRQHRDLHDHHVLPGQHAAGGPRRQQRHSRCRASRSRSSIR